MVRDDLSKKLINITSVIFKISFIKFTEFHEGKLRLVPQVDEIFWKDYHYYTRTLNSWIQTESDAWGIWNETHGYTDGIFGEMQANRANKPFIAVPVYVRDLPGILTSYQTEYSFSILTFVSNDTKLVLPDLISNILTIGPLLWTLYLFILMFQILYHVEEGFSFSKIFIESLKIALRQGSTDYEMKKNHIYRMMKIFEGFLVVFFMCLCGAAFNTEAIMQQPNNRVDKLLDIVSLNKKPLFLDGNSAYELFSNGLGASYKAVFNQAKRMGSSVPVTLDTIAEMLASSDLAKSSIIGEDSNLVAIGDIMTAFQENRAMRPYLSKPYSKAVQMSLINPIDRGEIGEELIRRDKYVMNCFVETGLNVQVARRIKKFIKSNLQKNLFIEDKQNEESSKDDHSKFYVFSLKLAQFHSLIVISTITWITSCLINIILRFTVRIKSEITK